MKKYLTFVALVLALPMSGCDLGYVASISNLTSCPIQLSSALSGSEINGPFQIMPGRAVGHFGAKPETFAEIVVIDNKGVEHRYDKIVLAALRPADRKSDWWAYTDTGLIFLHKMPESSKLNHIVKQSCDATVPR